MRFAFWCRLHTLMQLECKSVYLRFLILQMILDMTNKGIKRLETELWGAADELRANSKLTAAEYKDPVWGLILLRYAQKKFEEAKEIDKKTATSKIKPYRAKLNKLNRPLKAYQELVNEHLKELKQGIGDWQELLKCFPDNTYTDVEGLCKIVDLDEVKENDYSLTPGRYVGYSIKIDEDFDYKDRMKEIHSELSDLNIEANELMDQILSVKP